MASKKRGKIAFDGSPSYSYYSTLELAFSSYKIMRKANLRVWNLIENGRRI
jgi:hypothetical protein